MRVAAIMDPLAGINYEKDTSYFLLRAALELGHEAFHIDQDHIYLDHNKACARISQLKLSGDKIPKLEVIDQQDVDLSAMRLIFFRTDPPFDRRYFYSTLILDHLPESTRVVNSTKSLRDWNEKLAALEFPEHTPPTMISSQWEPIKAFAEKQKSRLVLKPMDGNGGKGIEFAQFDQKDLEDIIARKTNQFSHRLVVQRYMPEAKDGDIRVLFLRDKILGSFVRIAAEGEELNNLDMGASAHPWQLTENQKKICHAMAPRLIEMGADFVGIDFLGDYLIEINVTSPTGLQEICRFENKDFHHEIIQTLIK